MLVGASILSANFADLKTDLIDMQKSGVDFWHIDVMDGYFVPNLTFGMDVIKTVPATIPFQIHLMVENPERIYELFSSNIDIKLARCEFIFHVENQSIVDLKALIQKVKSDGHKVGLAINPPTMVSELDPYINLLDSILIMSVNPGFSGQKFISGVLNKVDYIKSIRNDIKIGLDGGVDSQIAKLVNSKKIDFLVSGSFLFNSESRKQAVLELKE
jgi:ribulose-phosphate 3-epimerase